MVTILFVFNFATSSKKYLHQKNAQHSDKYTRQSLNELRQNKRTISMLTVFRYHILFIYLFVFIYLFYKLNETNSVQKQECVMIGGTSSRFTLDWRHKRASRSRVVWLSTMPSGSRRLLKSDKGRRTTLRHGRILNADINVLRPTHYQLSHLRCPFPN